MRLHSVGFELNSTTAGMEFDTCIGSPTFPTTNARLGIGRAMRMTGLTSALAKYIILNYASTIKTWHRVYFRLDTLPSAENHIVWLNNSGDRTTPLVMVTVDNLGVMRLYDEDGQITGTTTITTGVYYNLEIKVDTTGAGSTDIVEARINGIVYATSSTRNLSANPAAMIVGINLNSEANTAGDIYFDDLAIHDAQDVVQNSYPGEGKIIYCFPAGAGPSNQWKKTNKTTAGDASNYQLVDDVPPNDATDFIASTTANDLDLYTIAATPIATIDTVNVVQMGIRWANDSAAVNSSLSAQLQLVSHGGTDTSPSSYGANTATWKTNADQNSALLIPKMTLPTDGIGATWTKQYVDSMQIGVKCINASSANFMIVTSLWAIVDYTPAINFTPPNATLTLTSFVPTVTVASSGTSVTPGTATLATTSFAPTVTVSNNQNVTPNVATLTTSTFVPVVFASNLQNVTPGVASLTTTTFAPTVAASNNQNVVPGNASLTTTTFTPSVTATNHQNVTPPNAALTTTTFIPTVSVSNNQNVVPGVASLTLATFAPTVFATNPINVTPGNASLTTTTFAPTISVSNNKNVTPATATLSITSFVPVVVASDHKNVSPGLATLSTTRYAPTVATTDHKNVTPTNAALTLTTFAPTVATTAHVNVTPSNATLTITSFAPVIAASGNQAVTPSTATLTITRFAPTVTASAHQNVVPSTASLTLTRFAPTITASDHKVVTPGVASLVITPRTPTVVASDHKIVIPGTAALVITSFAPTVFATDTKVVVPSTLNLTTLAFAPTVFASDHQVVIPLTAGFVIIRFPPTVVATSSSTGDFFLFF